MTKKEFIINSIQHMDIESLHLMFDDNQILQECKKTVFFNKLNEVFNEFKNYGDTELTPHRGFCNAYGCTKEQGFGYSFVGNKSNIHFAATIFEPEENEVYFENCHDFILQDTSIEMEGIIKFDIYEDEKHNFIPTPRYSVLNTVCSGSLIQLKNQYKNKILNKEIYIRWLEKFKLTYEALKEYRYSYSEVFTKFRDFYSVLEDLVNYLENEESCINAINEYKSLNKSNETDLLKWLIKYENVAINLVAFLEYHGDINPENLEDSPYFKIDFLKINVYDFKNIIRFKILHDEHYWEILDKYMFMNDETINIEEPTTLYYYLNKNGIKL